MSKEVKQMERKNDTVISVKDLFISFKGNDGTHDVVNGISFDIERGRITALAGRSGCGKSVTALALMGMLDHKDGAHCSGRILFKSGDEQADMLSSDAKALSLIRRNHISMVFQDPGAGLNPVQRIKTQICRAVRLKEGPLGKNELVSRSRKLLEEAGLDADKVLPLYPHELSGGMKQRVAIALALAGDPELIIADEPTTALDGPTQEGILGLLEKLKKDRGCAIFIISHDICLLKRISDKFLVMDGGRILEDEKDMSCLLFWHAPSHMVSHSPDGCGTVLSVRHLEKIYKDAFPGRKTGTQVLDDVSFTVGKGDVLAIAGRSGCGKSTLAKAIMRLIPVDRGEILFYGTDITRCGRKEFADIRARIQMVFQDTYSSLDPLMPSAKQIMEAVKDNRITEKGCEEDYVFNLLASCGITRGEALKRPTELSGGQRQRISIARALALKPDLLIADEPVSSIDGMMRNQIMELLMEQKRKNGLSLIIISHDLSFLRSNADHIAIMQDGRIIEMDETERIFTHPAQPYTRLLTSSILY